MGVEAERRVIRGLTADIIVMLVIGLAGILFITPDGGHPRAGLPAPPSQPATTGSTTATTLSANQAARASEASPSAAAETPAPPVFPVPDPPTGWKVAGRSVQGRAILVKRFGHGPRKVLWLGGIHGDEIEGSVATANLPAAFAAAHLEKKVTLVVIWDGNPDGRALHIRTNANGVDLNREFPAANFGYGPAAPVGDPLSQPEARVIHDLVVAEKPDLVVACHSWRGDQFVNYDGPAAAIAARFSSLSGFPVKTSDQLGPDLSGSMGNWIGVDMGIPILTIEWLHGSDPVVGWQETQKAIIASLT